MSIATRQQFINYCLRGLGAPMLEINLDQDQIEDRIDEAVEYFRLHHYDGIEKIYLKHEITAENCVNQYIDLPELIYGVTKVLPVRSSFQSSQSMFDVQYQLRLNDLYNLTSSSIIYYHQVMSHLALLESELQGHQMFRFNRLAGKLFIEADWKTELYEGTFIIAECYRAMDPDEVHLIWSNNWLKHYATALLKKQFGTNLKKFNNMQLPGGVTIDGQSIYTEAMQEIRDLEENLRSKESPLEFFMG